LAQCTAADVPAGGDLPVTRIPNADRFLLEFRKICGKYEQRFGPHVADVRKNYTDSPQAKHPSVDESLEAHIKAYLINALLLALNWRLDLSPETGLPNLVPEAPIQSLARQTIRFLDYLGLERDTDDPLLVVETKRPSSPLPGLIELSDNSLHPLSLTYPEIISRGLADTPLTGDWSQWLPTLKDYVRSIHAKAKRAPKRAVLTNGDWLILFLDPSDAFLDGGTYNPNRILVFSSRSDIEQRYTELFRFLEHGAVLGETPGLMLGELPFHVAGKDIDRLMHGLHLHYFEDPGIYQPSPLIKVAPVIFLRSQYGTWLRVEAPPTEYQLPYRRDDLPVHLAEVRDAAVDLLAQVNTKLGIRLQASPLSKHYEDEDSFEPIRGVIERGKDEFFVVTGDKTHYLMPEPSVRACPHHDWAQSHAIGVASSPNPIMWRSIDPRAFFTSQEEHHCAHRDVAAAKASRITSENQGRCGSRSGQEGNAFCEIWRFEVHLCCRTCAFEEVCTKAKVFHLPCQSPKVHGQTSRQRTTKPRKQS
jgi:hypothetical protein